MADLATIDDELTLFDVTPYRTEPETVEPAEKLSADRRRTIRQAEAIRRGVHPLTLVYRLVVIHPEADRTAVATDRRDLPLRCGSCRFRQSIEHHRRSYPKCTWREENPTDQAPNAGGWPRAAHSTATDVRAFWPVCTKYSPGDGAMSDDAARFIPDFAGATS